TVGSNLRPKGAPPPDNFSPPPLFAPGPRFVNPTQVSPRPPPDHMAPKRAKWTSPPPPDASPSDHKLYETSLGKSLELATSSMTAREKDEDSSGNSEPVEEGERSDAAESDVHSVHSEAGGRRISWQELTASAAQAGMSPNAFIDLHASGRGRPKHHHARAPTELLPAPQSAIEPSLSAKEFTRRSISGPARPLHKAGQQNHSPPQPHTSHLSNLTLPPSPVSPPKDLQHNLRTAMDLSNSATVFYQTTVPRSPVPVVYPVPGSPHLIAPYYAHFAYPTPPHDVLTGSSLDALTRSNLQPSLSHRKPPTDLTWSTKEDGRRQSYGQGPLTLTPASYHHANVQGMCTMTPPPLTTKFSLQSLAGGSSYAGSSSPSSMSAKPPRMHSSGGSPSMRSPVMSGMGLLPGRVPLSTQAQQTSPSSHSSPRMPHSSPRMPHASPRMPHKRSFQKRRHSPQMGGQSPHAAPSPTLSVAAAVPIPPSCRASPSRGSPLLGSASPSSMGYAASASRSPSPVPGSDESLLLPGPDSPASRSNASLGTGPPSLPRSPVLSPHPSLLPSPPPFSTTATPPEEAPTERMVRVGVSLPPPMKQSSPVVVEEVAVLLDQQTNGEVGRGGDRER
ncbi:hypothetical protein HDZ31DRAFT_50175, partial [Schizophyllum fasciatum]